MRERSGARNDLPNDAGNDAANDAGRGRDRPADTRAGRATTGPAPQSGRAAPATALGSASGHSASSGRSAAASSRRSWLLGGGWWKAVAGLAVFWLLAASPAFMNVGSYWLYMSTLTLIYVLGAAGLNLILGYAGQISLAQGAFMGIGGYTVAILVAQHGWPMLAALAAGGVVGFGLGLLVGIPALRMGTHYLAMMTLGVEVVYLAVVTNESGLTGGAEGMSVPIGLSLGRLHITSGFAYELFVAVVVTLVLGALVFILRSPWGRAFKGIRENETRAAMLGVNIRAYKLLAFAIGCSVAAIGGGMVTPVLGFVDPDTFGLGLTFNLLLMVVVGGRGRFEGAVLGAMLVTLLPQFLQATQNVYLIVFAALTILLLMFMPRGMIALLDWVWVKIVRRPVPELTK